MRVIIFHYHLFKNAGTSIDHMLKESFGSDKFLTKEFPKQKKRNQEQVREWIVENPDAIVFSSHSSLLPPPKIEGVLILPIVFLREPLERIFSAYHFERAQNAPTFGSTVARNTSLSGYIEIHLSQKINGQCRNFHTEFLCQMNSPLIGDKIDRAYKTLKSLPFVGIVERFDESVVLLQKFLSEHQLSLNFRIVKKNVSKNKIDKDLKEFVTPVVYQDLLDSNKDDSFLYQEAFKRHKYKYTDYMKQENTHA